ncbi:Clavaminate synthase-like protein, partial [Macroventuria anomochaeta]
LAPKRPIRGGNKPTIRDQSSSTAISRHRRKVYPEDKLKQTNKTRELASCARCKAQRRRCKPNPEGDHLPCLTCLTTKAGPRYASLGCIRSRISDCQLFRTGVGFYTFYQKHPMIGSTYGDFHLQESRMWVRGELHILEITQDMGPVCRFEVRQFIPPVEPDAVDLKGRSMYHVPWAIADADKTTRAFNVFLDKNLVPYLRSVLNEDDELFGEVFRSAIRIAHPNAPKPRNTLVHKTLRLWVACRFIEGKWRCCGSDVLRAGELKNPFRSPDWVSPPPYIDYQYASIIMHRILGPLSKAVLKELQDLVDKRKPRDWYTIFLVTFILLHNYERGILFQRVFWAKRRMTVGNVPFGIKFDWNTETARKMAEIDQEQVNFLTKLGVLVRQKGNMHSYKIYHPFSTMAPSILDNTPSQQPSPYVPAAKNSLSRVRQWPKSINNALTWSGSSFQSESDFTLEATESHNQELRQALDNFLSLGLDGREISPENFLLPKLGDKLRQGALDVHSGRGFVTLRGIDFDRYSCEDGILIFLGISSYFGEKRAKQDDQGNMLMHIRDAKASSISQGERPTRFSNRASTFHSDPFPNVLGLFTKSCAAKGGNHIVASSVSIYNEIAATRPDILESLAEPNWPFDSPGGLIERELRPILFYHGGHIILNYAREPLLGLGDVPRTSGFPNLTSAQREALDLLEATAQAHRLTLKNQPGDLVFVNNHGLLHSREAFEDDGESSRYLIRLWLKNQALAWKLPRVLREGNERLFESNEVEEQWNIMPLPRLTFTVAERLSS